MRLLIPPFLLPLLFSPAQAADMQPVLAATDGVVVYAGSYFSHGTIVDLRRQDGRITRYAHLARIARGITPGAVVHAGQELGATDPSAVPAARF